MLVPGRRTGPGVHYQIGRVYLARARPPYSEAPTPRPTPLASSSRSCASIPRTPTQPTSSERSRARRESSTRRASSSRRPSSTTRSSRKAWSGWVVCSCPRARRSSHCLPSRKAVTLDPEDEVAYFQIYQAHRALGHAAEAQKAQAEFQRLRAGKREAERRDLLRQHVVTQQELDAQMSPRLADGAGRNDGSERSLEMSTTRRDPGVALRVACVGLARS